MRKILFGLTAMMLAGGAFAATDYPSGYTKCAQADGSTCSMSGTRSVALGKSGSFVYATKTGSFACKTSAFPANSFGTSAWCSYGATTSSSSSAAVSSSAASSKAASSVAASSSLASSKSSSSAAVSSAASSAASSSVSSGASSLCVAGGVIDGKEVDCGGITIGLSCAGDTEGQDAVLTLKNGAIVKNLHVKSGGGAHGISCTAGNCTLKNVTWDEVCEHAAGNYSEGGTFSIYDSTAYQALDNAYEHGSKPDKFFQDNAYNSKMYVRNFTAVMLVSTMAGKKDSQGKSVTTYPSSGKILRTCGDCSTNKGGRTLDLDGLTVKHVDSTGAAVSGPGLDTIAGINTEWDSTVPSAYAIPDKAILRNLKIQGYKLGSDGVKSTPKICDTYVGSRKHNGSTNIGPKWNTSSCDVKTSDVSSF